MSQTAKEMRLEAARLLQSIGQKEQDARVLRHTAARMAPAQVITDEAGREWTRDMLIAMAQIMEDEIAPIKAQARELQDRSMKG